MELPDSKELEEEFQSVIETAGDRARFVIMVNHLEAAKEAAKVLTEEGPLTFDSRDLPSKHPAAALFSDHAKEFRKILDSFESALEYKLSPYPRI